MAQVRLPKDKWVLVGVCLLASLLLAIYLKFGRYDHVSPGAYVGPESCRECHEEQAASWNETRMAKTFEVLRPGVKVKEKEMVGLDPDYDYTSDEECLPCHTTGYGLEGGFVSFETTPNMAGVTCEACHGPGGTYAEALMSSTDKNFTTTEARDAGLVYPPTTWMCFRCHNENSPFIGMDYKFDFSERVEQGTHTHFQLKYDHEQDE